MERAATATGKYPDDIPGNLKTVEGGRYTIEAESDRATFKLTAEPNDGPQRKINAVISP